LVFSLAGAPVGASINAVSGGFTWTPSESQGPGSYTFDVVVTDNGNPVLEDRGTITVTVVEVNAPPVLGAIGNRSASEGTSLSFTATASDPDLPANSLTFSLAGAPVGAAIGPVSGVFSWTPTETQGPGSYTFDVVVTDNGLPVLEDRETITVTVSEVNAPPVLGVIGNRSVNERGALSFTATATDPDIPSNTLAFSLAGAPVGAVISSASGAFSWTPSATQGPGTYTFDVFVTDNGSPVLEDRETITVTVLDITPPVMTTPGNFTVAATGPTGAIVNFTVTAVDNSDPTPVVSCTPSSGSTFAIGVTTVNCAATDSGGNRVTASFTVSVIVTAATVDGYEAMVVAVVVDTNLESAFISKLETAQDALAAGDFASAKTALQSLLNQINAKDGKKNGLTTQQAAQLRTAITTMLNAIP
jgi:hypothetical protein